MMYNPQLDTFICVVEAGSFSKAADKLYISPPAVIKQINSFGKQSWGTAFCQNPQRSCGDSCGRITLSGCQIYGKLQQGSHRESEGSRE